MTRSSEYAGLREVLAPEYRNWKDQDVEALFESYNLSAEDMEGFFDTLKDIGKAVVNKAPSVLPVAGTVVGSAFGGPVGGAVGGALGNLAGGAISHTTAHRKSSPTAMGIRPSPQVPQLPPGASPAAGQLMQSMFRPEMLQALMQMLLGQLGGGNVKVGSTPVPVGGFTNLLGVLANQAQAEYNTANPSPREGLPEYLRGYAGEAVVDPAVSEERAWRLHEMLQETDVEQVGHPRHSRGGAFSEVSHEDNVFYVELEPTEVYSEDEFS